MTDTRSMSVDRFWALIEANVRVKPDGSLDASRLVDTLATLPPQEIVEFGYRGWHYFAGSRIRETTRASTDTNPHLERSP